MRRNCNAYRQGIRALLDRLTTAGLAAWFLATSGTCFAQCGSATAGPCCSGHPTPFCDNADCCDAVCALDPYCCEVAWNADCVAIAEQLCRQCGAACGSEVNGSCCQPQNNPYCSDADCCEAVCAADPFCCDTQWDEQCASEAFDLCAGCIQCGSAGAGDCCSAHANPFCDDATCCGKVCARDPFCCETAWDETCVTEANELCLYCPQVCPGEGDCCLPHDTPGCDMPECCAAICEADAFCCAVAWDSTCAHEALLSVDCPCNFGGCEGDINGDRSVNGADLAVLLGDWGQGGPADLDGDGTTDGADLATLLGAWGPC